MPGFDRTGPVGAGPRSGWGRGLCGTTVGSPRYSWSGLLRGVGRGGFPRGGGRGRCWGGGGWRQGFRWTFPPSGVDEAEALRTEIAALKEELAALEARLSEFGKNE